MHAPRKIRRPASALRRLLASEAGGGLVLMASAAPGGIETQLRPSTR